jgi:hypothetical protein
MTKPTPSDRLKCRYCDYTVMRWRAGKSGKPVSGMNVLLRHGEAEHLDEFMAEQDRITERTGVERFEEEVA